MDKEFWTYSEVMEFFHVDARFLSELEEEEIVCPVCRENPPSKLFTVGELEKLRLAKILIEEMNVNLPGVEIILRMRRDMIAMRRQFDTILEELAKYLQETQAAAKGK